MSASAAAPSPGPHARHDTGVHDEAMSVIVAAVGDGVIGLDEADVMMQRLVAADDAKARALLRELPGEWTRRRTEAAAAEARHERKTAEARAHMRSMGAMCGGVSLLCSTIWAVTGFGYPWPVWPAMGTFIPVVVAYGDVRSARRAPARP